MRRMLLPGKPVETRSVVLLDDFELACKEDVVAASYDPRSATRCSTKIRSEIDEVLFNYETRRLPSKFWVSEVRDPLTHQGPALRAEVIRHRIACSDRLALGEFGQQVLTSNVLQS